MSLNYQSPSSSGPHQYGTAMHRHQKPPKKRKGPPRLLLIGGALAILVAIIISVAQGGSNSGSSASPGPSASTQPASPSAAPSQQPSSARDDSGSCTSRTCIAQEIQKSLVGIVAKDESVITKATCIVHTAKNDGNGNWTTECTATYSDGNMATGYGSLLTSQGKVAFEPESVNGGS